MIKKILVYILLTIPLFFGTVFAEGEGDSGDENDISSSSFMLDVSKLSPSDTKYNMGAEDNIKELSGKIVRIALVMLPTLSLLFMVMGAIMMITSGGSSEKITKGKNIIIYNIVAIVVALLSYSIVKLIIWILGSN
ncbi:hypothetical protein M0P65_03175 [Candidatus Gracilibacteria bacterium]|nr:hypothetical protein [Candidatus Gracilibacteria bacterium]